MKYELLLAAFDFKDLIGVPLRSSVSISAIVFALGAIGLNLHYGFTGLLNVGMVAFMAAGSYGMAIAFTQGWLGGSILMAIVAGLIFSVIIALLIGVPALRLRGDYLAIVTIAIGEVMRVSFRSQRLLDITGGPFGLPSIEDRGMGVSLSDRIGQDWNPFFDADNPTRTYELFWTDIFAFDAKTIWLMVIGWTLVALMTILVWQLVNSPWGRVIKAIREDEDAARALGKNVFNYKLQSLIIGGMIGAIAGIVRTLDSSFVQSEQFRPQTTFFIWTALILGGAASKWGPVIGAALFWFALQFVEELIRQLVENDWIPDWLIDSNDIGRIRLIMMGVMLAALMIWRPQGLLGKKEEALLDVCSDNPVSDNPVSDIAPAARTSGLPTSEAKAQAAKLLTTVDPVPGSVKPDSILTVNDVSRSFGGLKAVDVKRLEVQRGIITAFIGPNGAGKTTFFNLLTGFDEPDTGKWQFNGAELSGVQSHRIAQQGMVRTFQLTKSLAKMTVMDNMLLGAPKQKGEKLAFSLLRGTWRSQEALVRAKAEELLERFNMTHMADEYAATLSGGQRKLLEMARALMADPALILLDEPMAGVNPALVQSLLGHVEALRDDGVSVLFVEHDMDVIMGISDWIVVLAEGGVIAEGTPDQVSKNAVVINAYLGTDDGIATGDGRTGADAQ